MDMIIIAASIYILIGYFIGAIPIMLQKDEDRAPVRKEAFYILLCMTFWPIVVILSLIFW